MATKAIDLVLQRLRNQKLARSPFRRPDDVVGWLGAAQAQDYPAARWALGLRGAGITDAAVERAFDKGAILRTHVLRPTWHFVTPADIRWMLALTAPRVQAVSASTYRAFELDGRTLARSRTVLERALEGGMALTRAELAVTLRRAGIVADGPRLGCLMMHAELERVICSGPRRGKQFTYALFDERVPAARPLDRDAALAELTRRYFLSRGPATARDYAWWSGLTVREATAGIGMIGSALEHHVIDGQRYWFAPARSTVPALSPSAHLLPNYDEYLIAYKDSRPVVPEPRAGVPRDANGFAHPLVINGRLAGSWSRRVTTDVVLVEAVSYRPLTRVDGRVLAAAAERYGRFLGVRVVLTHTRAGARARRPPAIR